MNQRIEQRIRTVFRPSCVQGSSGVSFAVLRNFSPGGASFLGTDRISVGEQVTYRHGNTDWIRAAVKWVNGFEFGVEHAEPLDVESSQKLNLPYRSVRVPLAGMARIYAGGDRIDGELRNLSQCGAALLLNREFEVPPLITVSLGRSIFSTVSKRWQRGRSIGLKWDKPVGCGEFGNLVLSLR